MEGSLYVTLEHSEQSRPKKKVYHDVIIKRLALCSYLCSGHSPSVSFFLGKCDFFLLTDITFYHVSVLILHVFFVGIIYAMYRYRTKN